MDVCGKLGKPACNRIERLESVGRCGARPSARRCLAVAIGSEGGCPLSYRGKALSLGPGGVAARWTMEPNLARMPIPGGEPEGPSAGAGASPCLASPVQLSKAPARALRKRTGQARLAAGRSLIRDTAGGPNAGGRFQVRCQQRDPCTESVGSDNLTQAVLQMLSVTSGTTALARWRTPTPCSQMACIPFVQRPPRRPNRALTSPLTSISQRLHLVQSRHLNAQCPTLHFVAITSRVFRLFSASRTITHKLLVRAPRRSTISKYQAT